MTDKRPLQPNDLYRLALISDPQIAPDGSRVAFVLKRMDEEKHDYLSNIYMVDREGSVTQFTAGDKDSSPRWSPDGTRLAFLSGRKEKGQIFLLSTAGGEARALTDCAFGVQGFVWSPDGTAIAFTAATPLNPAEEEEAKQKKDDKTPAKTKIVERASYKSDGVGFIGNRRRHIFVVDVNERKIEQLTSGDCHDGDPAWSPDGRHIAFSSSRETRWDVSTEHDIYLIPREGGQPRRITSGHSFGSPVFSPDGSRIAVVGEANPDDIFAPSQLYSIARDGSDLRDELGDWFGDLGNAVSSDVVHGDDGWGLVWRDEGLMFIASQRGDSNIWCAKDGQVTQVTSGHHNITDWSITSEGVIAYSCSGPTTPAEVFLMEKGKVRRLTDENKAFLDEVIVPVPERISYTGARGEESDAWVLAPVGHESGKHPLIVYIHGGPQTHYGDSFFFEYEFLADNGFGVYYPNIHGSSSYGRDYQSSIWGQWGTIDFEDVMAGLDEVIRTHDWVDPNRIGIIGGSYGGYMTLWAMTHSDRFKAGITERCLSNWVSFMGTSDSGWLWNRIHGGYPEDRMDVLWEMSPIKHIANVQAPLAVIHYERDDRTPIEQGEQVFNALRRLGKETKFIIYPEESHGMTRGGNPMRRVERLGLILDWFKTHL